MSTLSIERYLWRQDIAKQRPSAQQDIADKRAAVHDAEALADAASLGVCELVDALALLHQIACNTVAGLAGSLKSLECFWENGNQLQSRTKDGAPHQKGRVVLKEW